MELLEGSVGVAAGNRHAGNEAGSPRCCRAGVLPPFSRGCRRLPGAFPWLVLSRELVAVMSGDTE